MHLNSKDCLDYVKLLENLNKNLDTVQDKVNGLHTQIIKKKDLPTSKGMSILQAKNGLLLHYSTLSLFFSMIKMKQPDNLQNYPIFSELIRSRIVLDKLRLMDRKIKYQVDKMIKIANSTNDNTNNTLNYAPRPEALVSKFDEINDPLLNNNINENKNVINKKKGTEENKNNSLYRVPHIAPVPYEEEDKAKDKEKKLFEKKMKIIKQNKLLSDIREEFTEKPLEVSINGSVTIDKEMENEQKEKQKYEEDKFIRLVTSKKDKIRMRQKEEKTMQLQSIMDIDNFAGVQDVVNNNNQNQTYTKYTVNNNRKTLIGSKVGGIFSHLQNDKSVQNTNGNHRNNIKRKKFDNQNKHEIVKQSEKSLSNDYNNLSDNVTTQKKKKIKFSSIFENL